MFVTMKLSRAFGWWGSKLMLAALAVVPCVQVRALDPTVEDLRAELRSLFPTPAVTRMASDPAAPVNPYAIVRREYLYANPFDLAAPSTRVSLSRIREYPPALIQAHAACVRVITPYWQGAGVIVSTSGDILTSYHLMAGAITASVQTLEGRLYPVAAVQAYSAVDDLALVHIEDGPFPALPVLDGVPPVVDAPLFVVGHPVGQSWKLTEGRVIRECEDGGTRVLHFSSDIGHGNSGGPVVDTLGRLCAVTACAAELADGSKVKVGTAADAIRDFLAKRPGSLLSLPDLAEAEHNRQAAEFLKLIYGFTDSLMADWQTAIAQADVESVPDIMVELAAAPLTARAPAKSVQSVSFAHTQRCCDTALQLVMLQALMKRCTAAPGLSAELRSSMSHYSAMLDGLIDAAVLLSRKTSTPDEARRKLRLAAERQSLAVKQFGTAAMCLLEAGKSCGLSTASQRGYASLDQIRAKYETPGCRVQSAPGG